MSRRFLPRLLPVLAVAFLLAGLSGCSSLLTEGTSAGAGIAGAAIADQVTDNAAAATGIGLGVQAAAKAGLQYLQREARGEQQNAIALAAADLKIGEVADWHVAHSLPIERDTQGQVTVSRFIGGVGLSCKEVVFSVVEQSSKEPDAEREFFVTTLCKDAGVWRWANAEPATARWGSLQ